LADAGAERGGQKVNWIHGALKAICEAMTSIGFVYQPLFSERHGPISAIFRSAGLLALCSELERLDVNSGALP
jgi:hypothetical protein